MLLARGVVQITAGRGIGGPGQYLELNPRSVLRPSQRGTTSMGPVARSCLQGQKPDHLVLGSWITHFAGNIGGFIYIRLESRNFCYLAGIKLCQHLDQQVDGEIQIGAIDHAVVRMQIACGNADICSRDASSKRLEFL